MKDVMTDKDWIDEIATRLVNLVDCVRVAQKVDIETALEIALSHSCAGPKAIERARQMLGLTNIIGFVVRGRPEGTR